MSEGCDFRVWRGLSKVKDPLPCILTFGNFDGVHCGHQQLVARAKRFGVEFGLPVVVLCFWPPSSVVLRGLVGQVIQGLSLKLSTFRDLGVDHVIVESFSPNFMQRSAQDFMGQILSGVLQPRVVVVGRDCRFGRGGEGDLALLHRFADSYRVRCEVEPEYLLAGVRVASTEVRKLLASNMLAEAREMLGRNWMVRGVVCRGERLGGELGFPTINLKVSCHLGLAHGVFAVRVMVGGSSYNGVASWGVRPVVGEDLVKLLEVHILDFSDDIYSQYVTVEFLGWLRNEMNFENLEELKINIIKDIAAARRFFR